MYFKYKVQFMQNIGVENTKYFFNFKIVMEFLFRKHL